MNKNTKKLIAASLIVVLIFISACSREKNVNSEAFDLFKKELSSNERIDDIQIRFLRPSLFINFTTSEDFKIDDVQKVMDKLKPLINTRHMNEIANKYWGEGTKILSVYVYFYNGKIEKNDATKNLRYSIYADYYKTNIAEDTPSNIDDYRTWFIEVDGNEYQFESYLNVWR